MRFYLLPVSFLGLCYLVELRTSRVLPKYKPDVRIVGGYEVSNISAIPFQVSVQLSGSHFCGGSLISHQWVLTAAHCMDGVTVSQCWVRAGSLMKSLGGVLISVSKIYQHPKFNWVGLDYDFSLLQLAPWSSNDIVIGFASLPRQGEDVADGTTLTVSGWGHNESSTESSFSEFLHAASIPKYNQEKCRKAYMPVSVRVTDRMICAGHRKGGKNSCRGDSGGPLAMNGKVVGVTSWSIGCAVAGYPAVYARVASIRDWIKSASGV